MISQAFTTIRWFYWRNIEKSRSQIRPQNQTQLTPNQMPFIWWLFMGLPETVGHGGFALPNEERVKVARCMLLFFVPSWFFFISGTFTHSLHSDMSWYATSKCFSRWFTAKGQVLVKSRIVEFRGYQDHCQRPNNFVPRHQSFFEAVANWLRPPTWGNREGCYTLPEILTNCLTRIIPWPQLSDLICQILVCRN